MSRHAPPSRRRTVLIILIILIILAVASNRIIFQPLRRLISAGSLLEFQQEGERPAFAAAAAFPSCTAEPSKDLLADT